MFARRSLIFVPALVAGIALMVFTFWSAGASADGQPRQNIVEEVRHRRVGDLDLTWRISFDPAFPGDTKAVADDMVRGAGFTDTGDLAAAFVVGNPWAPSAMPISVRYNPAFDITQNNPVTGAPETVSMQASIGRSIETWNAIPNSSLRFRDDGTTAISAITCDTGTPDQVNIIRFATLPPGVLGSTCTASTQGRIIEFDMEISTTPSAPWATALPVSAGAFDLDSVLLHELGHAVGVGHTNDTSAVMFASLAPGVNKRTPVPDDIAAIQALYGIAATPTATASPSPTVSPPTATPPPTTTLSVFPNSPYAGGLNAIVVQGSGPAGDISATIAISSGRTVLALWVFSGGSWKFYLPATPAIDGGLAQFPGPVISAFVALG